MITSKLSEKVRNALVARSMTLFAQAFSASGTMPPMLARSPCGELHILARCRMPKEIWGAIERLFRADGPIKEKGHAEFGIIDSGVQRPRDDGRAIPLA